MRACAVRLPARFSWGCSCFAATAVLNALRAAASAAACCYSDHHHHLRLFRMRRFSVELLRESPSPALRACCNVAVVYHPLARDLFNAGFVSCWNEL